MIVTIDDMIQRLEKVDVMELTRESITETEKAFVQLQTEQMYAGKLNDGSPIDPPYAASTVRYKKRKKQPYDRVTTRDSNEYHSTMQAKAEGDDIKVGSDVEYEQYLDKKYSKKLYGLTPVNNEQYTFGPFWEALKRKLETGTQLDFV